MGIWFNEIIEFQPTTTQYRVQVGFFGGSGWVFDFNYDDVILYEQITQNIPPAIDSVQVAPLSGIEPFMVSGLIFAVEEDGIIENYIVDAGDRAVYTGSPSISHTYRVPGNYKINVTVVDDNAATDTVSFAILASSPDNYLINITSPQPQNGSPYYTASSNTINITGIRENGTRDVFWINNKTQQSGFLAVNDNSVVLSSLELLPGLNRIHVQSLFGDGHHLKDELEVYYMPPAYTGPLISNILVSENSPEQY